MISGIREPLEGTLGAARERAELLSGFAKGGVWDKCPPGPELAAALARAAGPGLGVRAGDRGGADRAAARPWPLCSRGRRLACWAWSGR